MKQAYRNLYLAVLLAARAAAQSITIINNPSDTGAVTSYYSICPTDSSTTITISTTTTICPGPNCGGTTTVFYEPQPITTVGPDGETTVFEEFPYTVPCPCDGGICDAVYTVTRECPCTAGHSPTVAPADFVTTAVACHACAQRGGPSTVTVITPAPNGPYATQTPVMGTPYNGASASAGASAYASAGPNGAEAGAGANAVASAGNGDASAQAGSDADAYANSDNTAGSANSNVDVNAEAGNGYTSASPNPVFTPLSNSTGITPPIASYTGSADRAVYAVSAIIAGVVGCMACLL